MATDLDADDMAALRRLRQVGRRLARIEVNREALYAERLSLFRQLDESGVRHGTIAEAAGMNREAVSQALFKARRPA